ncbi:MAG: AarF/ABC1/UbiB kinase family protein [Lewinellaceae bacterium]|nr:AarF/ABC1/UbiB kinase family protein [Lewinellaceae bacterium]
MPKEKIYSPSWRIRKAYAVAIIVMGSYGGLLLGKKLFGKRYYEKRIIALHVRNAERVKLAILKLKGLFIKVGQMLSILGNFLPEEFQAPLEALQDKIPPRPLSEVRERIVREFGKEPEALFTRFDETPVASASIGQVHRAQLSDGTEVAVKIQHANIEEIAKVDLRIIQKLTRLISWIFDIKGIEFVYTQIRKMIEEELDFARECQSMQVIAENLKEEERFVIPQVYSTYSTGRVITSTWQDGVKITNVDQLDDWQLDRHELASRLLRVYCHMVFKDGFYHVDPHPGNILVKQDGTLVLLDFGAVAKLGRQLREGIPQLIEAAVRNDTDAMVEACRFMGFIAEGREAEKMAEKMINALRNFLQNEVDLKGLNFKDIEIKPFDNSLFDLIKEIGFNGIAGTVQVSKDWVLMERMIALLLGICTTLDDTMNPIEVVRPYVKEFVTDKQGNTLVFITGLLRRTLATVLGLPDELHRVLQKAKKGELEVQTPDIRESAKLLYQTGQQFIYTLLLIAAGTFGFLFHQNGELRLANFAFGVAGFFFLLLLRSLARGRKIRRKLDE